MRRIRIIAHMSADGVIQSPGGPDEDRDGGFRHGGWIAAHADPSVGEAIAAAHGETFDLLLGRRTYDIWSGYWPKAGRGPLADGLNAATKYVATRRPESLGWGPAAPLGPDIAEGVRRLKQGTGPDLIVWGSTTLIPMLLEQGLADALLLMVYPVLLGRGKRVFPEGADPQGLTLADSAATPSGVLLNTYRPTGSLQTGRVGDAGG